MEIDFKKFDMNLLKYDEKGDFLNPRICCIGASGTGKSWIIRNIMNCLKDIPCAVIICPTDSKNGFYDELVPKSFIYHEYRQDILPRILKRQNLIIEKNKSRVKEGKKKIDPRILFIMDDCMSSKHLWLKDPLMLSIFNEGRHYQITFILAMQYSLGIQPELRSNFNFIFLLGEDTYSNRKRLFEHYAGIFPKREIFELIFSKITENYGCMVINNRIKGSNIKEKVFHYKANKNEPFIIGSKTYKNWDRQHYDPNYMKREEEGDILNIFCNKKLPNIKVKLK